MTTPDMSKYYWQGKLIRLREMREEDLDLWLEEDEDSASIRTLNPGMALPKTIKNKDAFAEDFCYFNSLEKRIFFSIETLSGELVGGININSIDRTHGTFGTGTRIYREFRHKGYALEAKIIVLRYAFYELRLHKFNAKCLETNEDILKHQLALGCKEEGRERESIYTNGRYYDWILFGMTKDEYEEKYGVEEI